MELDNLLKNKFKEIDRESERKRNITKYLINFIEENYKAFMNEFKEKINDSFKKNLGNLIEGMEEKECENIKKKFFEESLYNNILEEINLLKEISSNVGGIGPYREEIQFPRVKLGFVKYLETFPESKRFNQVLTKKGKKIINGDKEARELQYFKELISSRQSNNNKNLG